MNEKNTMIIDKFDALLDSITSLRNIIVHVRLDKTIYPNNELFRKIIPETDVFLAWIMEWKGILREGEV